jgi:cytochrome c
MKGREARWRLDPRQARSGAIHGRLSQPASSKSPRARARKRLQSAAVGLLVLLADPASGQPSVRERGEAIAAKHCERCHAIRDAGESPMALAPPFRDLSKRYPIENLAEALAEGIVTGHPAMPRFTFEPREIDALLTYIAGLTPSPDRAPRKR